MIQILKRFVDALEISTMSSTTPLPCLTHRKPIPFPHTCAPSPGPYLADHELVAVVVAREVGEDARSTRHHVDVVAAQQLHQGPEETLHALLQKRTEGEGKARQTETETQDILPAARPMETLPWLNL